MVCMIRHIVVGVFLIASAVVLGIAECNLTMC